MRERAISVRVTYDSGAGYVYLTGEGDPEQSAHQVPLNEDCGYHGRDIVVLDFDAKWRLIGIEVLDADRSLPASLVRKVKGARQP